MNMSTSLLIVGFCILYLYDINSITKKYLLINKFFFLGSILIVLASVTLVIDQWNHISTGVVFCVSVIGFIGSFVLLIYTLFFALPFDDTYKSETNQICDVGMYALSRHPGVIWFFVMFLSLFGIFRTNEMVVFCIIANVLNVFYVVLQDFIIFPRIFGGYDLYKVSTPFLIPNSKSIQRCIKTIRR